MGHSNRDDRKISVPFAEPRPPARRADRELWYFSLVPLAPLHVCLFVNGNFPQGRCFQSSGLPLVTYFVVFLNK